MTSLAFHPGGEQLAIAGRDPPQRLDRPPARDRRPKPGATQVDRARTPPRRSEPGADLLSGRAGLLALLPDGELGAGWTHAGRRLSGRSGCRDPDVPAPLRRLSGTPVGKSRRRWLRDPPGCPACTRCRPGACLYADDDVTYVVDARTLRVRRRYPVGGYTAAVSADGKMLALGSDRGAIRMLDLPSGEVERLRRPHRRGRRQHRVQRRWQKARLRG